MWGFGKKKNENVEDEVSSDDDLGGGSGKAKHGTSFMRTNDDDDEDTELGKRRGRKKRSSSRRRSSKKEEASLDDSEDDDELGSNSKKSSSKSSKEKQSSRKSKSSSSKSPDEDSDDDGDDDELGRGDNGKVSPKSSQKSTSTSNNKKKKSKKKSKGKSKEEVDDEEAEKSKREASIELVTANDLRLKVQKEDLESKSKKLMGPQILDYVSVPIFHDDGPAYVTNFDQAANAKTKEPIYERAGDADNCQGRILVPRGGSSRFGASRRTRWKEEVYVENVSSGRFSRVLYDLDENGKRIVMKKFRDEEHVSEYSPQRLRSSMNSLEYVMEGIFMVGQGLLSGGSLFQLIVILQISDPYTLLSIYGPLAREVRRMFFFLSVFSFVGVCDKITAERDQKKHWAERGSTERAEMYSYGVFFFVCLIFTLLAWPLVDYIDESYRESQSNPKFVITDDFLLILREWRWYIGLRFAFAALGWLLVCKDTNRDLLRGRQRFDRIEKCQEEIEKGKGELAKYNGKMLDNVSITELQRLSKALTNGLEEVRLQLDIRNKLSSSNT